MSPVLQVRLVQFCLCWLKSTSNSCINSVLGYKCSYSRIGGTKNSSNPVHLMLPQSPQRTCFGDININCHHVVCTLTSHAINCIILDHVLLGCTVFLSFYSTSYYICPYILLSTFPTSLHQSWNIQPARWGITIHRRIKNHTLRDHLHVHSGRQSIFIEDQMFELPTQLSSMVLEIANVRAIILMK